MLLLLLRIFAIEAGGNISDKQAIKQIYILEKGVFLLANENVCEGEAWMAQLVKHLTRPQLRS